MSHIIVVSGIDSSGKSTQIKNIEKYFRSLGIRYKVVWSRGGYTSWFQWIKNTVRKVNPSSLPPPGLNYERELVFRNTMIQRLWLFTAILDLIRLYSITLRFYRLIGYNIICDRYLWDTFIDFKMNFPNIEFEKWLLWKLLVILAPKPKISILVTISPEESMRRSKLKNEPFSESMERREKRYTFYMELINEGKWQYIINGERTIEEIWKDIREIIMKNEN